VFHFQRGLRRCRFEGGGGKGEDSVEHGVKRVERGFHDDGAHREGGFAPNNKWWFSQELPVPGCCFGVVVADLKMGL